MDNSELHKKENHCRELLCNKPQSIIECEAICKEIVNCMNEPVVVPKVKKERELLEGVTEYLIFWN